MSWLCTKSGKWWQLLGYLMVCICHCSVHNWRDHPALWLLCVFYLTAGESNGPPQNYPQCTAGIYSDLHYWCRSQVSSPQPHLSLKNHFLWLLEVTSFLTVPCSTLDDVLLSYITGVLEDLGSQQSVEENFDVEDFAEMLEAYIPGFAEIDR